MSEKELSIIIPYVVEYPQIVFTIRSIAEQLIGKVDFEIIAVDNYVEGPACRKADRGHDHKNKKGEMQESQIKQVSRFHDWLKYIRYDGRLSHWQAKNVGVKESSGRFIMFADAHVVPSHDAIPAMLEYYRDGCVISDRLGTINLPLTYHILEKQKLIYQMDINETAGRYHYRFLNFSSQNGKVIEVPVMSVCGMLMTREIFDMLGGFPPTLGIYGGGENFVNYCLAIMGVKKYIYPGGTLFHHGDQRGYNWNYGDYHKNRMTAVYLHSGIDTVFKYAKAHFVTSPHRLDNTVREIREECAVQRHLIESNKKMDVSEFVQKWKEKNFFFVGGGEHD